MLFILLAQLAAQVQRLPVKPPVTLALGALNVALHLRTDVLPALGAVCLAPSAILQALARGHGAYNGEVPLRLVGSAFVHADDFHLYYNMGSLLWKVSRSSGVRCTPRARVRCVCACVSSFKKEGGEAASPRAVEAASRLIVARARCAASRAARSSSGWARSSSSSSAASRLL